MKHSFIFLMKTLSIILFFLEMGCSIFGIRTVEETPYSLRFKDKDKEIRDYPPSLIAKTIVSGEYKQAQRESFRILADYIFGKNISEEEIAMTAPVTQEASNMKISMTAPVTQEKVEDAWTMTFAMPSKFKKVSDLPKPIDERIELLEKAPGLFAAIRFTWLTSEERNQKKTEELLEWIKSQKKYRVISTPYYAGYDPPWTIPFLRRQEILVEIEEVQNSDL